MTGRFLLLDLGASRSKSLIVGPDEVRSTSSFSTAGSNRYGSKIPLEHFVKTVGKHLQTVRNTASLDGIILCTEMHGYVNYDLERKLYSDYISWRSSSEKDGEIIKFLDSINFQNRTGLKPRSGLPIVNFLSQNTPTKHVRNKEVLFLPQAICRMMGRDFGCAHPTLSQSSGFFDFKKYLLDIPCLSGVRFPKISEDDYLSIGEINVGGHIVPVYGGYGDLQTSIYDTSPAIDQFIVNLGTGSQVAIITNQLLENFEKRSYFNKATLSAITHIPCGRAINVFADLLAAVRGESTSDYFWNIAQNLTIKDFNPVGMCVDMNVFPQAVDYLNGGSIKLIKEGALSPRELVMAILVGTIKPHADIIRSSSLKDDQSVILTGKMGTTVPIIPRLLEHMIDKKVLIYQTSPDSGIAGLKKIYTEL